MSLERFDRLLRRRVRIGIRQRFGTAIAVIAGLPQGGRDGGVIEVPQAGGAAVGIDEVDVADVRARGYSGKGTVHFVGTEDHPRNLDNSLYHGYLRNGTVYHSDGARVGELSTSTEATIPTWELTKVFQGTPDNVAWMIDLELDRDARPYVLFSCQIDGRGLPRGQGGMDLRYHYARWDGTAWHSEEIAHAGTSLNFHGPLFA